MLPATQGTVLREIWQEFEAAETPSARFAKALDACQPIFQTLNNAREIPDHVEIVQDNLKTGRARMLAERFPEAHAYAFQELGWSQESPSPDFLKRLAFLIEVDRLKTVTRATKLCDNSRRETSGEHSWHIAMYAWVLAEHAHARIDIARVLKMLLIHDLVEIDVGDAPIHGNHNIAEIEAKEAAAADRIFGLLPDAQGQELRALWDEFESAESDDAVLRNPWTACSPSTPTSKPAAEAGSNTKSLASNLKIASAGKSPKARRTFGIICRRALGLGLRPMPKS